MQRAVNPQTGEVLFLVDNQWVPPSQTAVNPQGEKAFLVGNEWITSGQQTQKQPPQEAMQQPPQASADKPQAAQPSDEDLALTGGIASLPAGQSALPVQKPEDKSYIGDQASMLWNDIKVGAKNTNIAIQNAKLAGMLEVQEARKSKYGEPENMPESVRKEYFNTQKSVESTLNNVGKTAEEIRAMKLSEGERASTKAFEDMQQSKEYKEGSTLEKLAMTGKAIMQDPVGIAADIGLQSLPQSMAIAATGIAARIGLLNPTASAAAGGMTSQAMEFGNQYAELRQQGMPHGEAWEKAGIKSGVIGLLDAVSMGSAGKAAGAVMSNLEKGAAKETVKDVVKETGKQSALGAAGEAGGSFAINQQIDPAQVLSEAIGEVFGAPGEAVSTYRGKKSDQKFAQERIDKVQKLIEDLHRDETAKAESIKGSEKPTEPAQPVEATPPVEQGIPPEQIEIPVPEKNAPEAPKVQAPQSESQDMDAFLREVLGEEALAPQAAAQEPSEIPAVKNISDLKREKIRSYDKDLGSISGYEEQSVPVKDLKLSKDVPQFKQDANERGIVEPLGGKYDPVGSPPIQVWRRSNGDLEVISGRHRLDLAKRSNTPAIKAQIFDESQGFDARQASLMDAELNIRNENGETKDYVQYFKATGLPKEDYESRGLLGRATGKRAYSVATEGTDELVSALNADKITGDDAYKISSAAPNDPRLQNLGLKLAQTQKIQDVVNQVLAAKSMPIEEGAANLDMFGFDDSGYKTIQQMAKIATRRQNELKQDISAIQGASKNPVIAKKYGVDVKDPESAKAAVSRMKEEKAKWENYPSHPEIMEQIRAEVEGRPVAKVETEKPAKAEKKTAEKKESKVEKVAEPEAAAEEEPSPEIPLFNVDPEKGVAGTPLVDRGLTIDETERLNKKTNEEIREEKMRNLQSMRQKMAAIERRFAQDKLNPTDQENYAWLTEAAKEMQGFVEITKPKRDSAADFMARAAKELAAGNVSQEVFDVIHDMYKKQPSWIDGLRLSVRAAPEGQDHVAGQFNNLARLIRLYKDTSGVFDPSTIRHEVAHSMELMMTPEQQKILVQQWFESMGRAVKADKTKEGQAFFAKVLEFVSKPSEKTQQEALAAMPNVSYYQYMNPSEFWAVNAERLLDAKLGGSWQKFKAFVKGLWESLKNVFGDSDYAVVNSVFKQIVDGERMNSSMLTEYVGKVALYDIAKSYSGGVAPKAAWDTPEQSLLSTFEYLVSDKNIDTKNVQKAIEENADNIHYLMNVYRKENLSHGRTAALTEDFLRDELRPIVAKMVKEGLSIAQANEYLHNRHAEERNTQVNKINPDSIKLKDQGSGIHTDESKAYMEGLSATDKAKLDGIAKDIDRVIESTQKLLVESGIEEQSTIDAWNKTYKYYVPLNREEQDFVFGATGTGKGISSRGGISRRASGSLRQVGDIFTNIALQRERAIVKSEKARIGRALLALAITNPNPEFWLPVNPDAIKNKGALKQELADLGVDPKLAENILQEPRVARIDSKTGLVTYEVNQNLRNAPNVIPVRVNGKDRFIFFNSSNPTSARMVMALKNLDSDDINMVFNTFGTITRWFASINTQYNPLFGPWNFMRDFGGAVLNLSSTDLAGKQKEVSSGAFPAMRGVYLALREKGAAKDNVWSHWFRDFSDHGGQTGYRDQFAKTRRQQAIIEREVKKLEAGNVSKMVHYCVDFLSDYNDAMENALRLSAYKVGVEQFIREGAEKANLDAKALLAANDAIVAGTEMKLSRAEMDVIEEAKDRAAELAKNLTVNFNKKGRIAQWMGVFYAFFNAAVQGTSRLIETMRGPAGWKIGIGGLLLGVVQAGLLALAGFEDDEPPEFIKERSIVIPDIITGSGGYVAIPMPLGFNIIPNTGRLLAEAFNDKAFGNGNKASEKILKIFSSMLSAFNPIGGGGFLQTVAPTFLDPIAALAENKDSFGRPIYKEDRATNPTAGYLRSREGATLISKAISYGLNWMTSPSDAEYEKGWLSPTPDQLDYFAGQLGGGLFREGKKFASLVGDVFEGDETAPYKIPFVGKLYGNKESAANIANRFYSNVTNLAKRESEIKGRLDNKQPIRDYMIRHPEARLIDMANSIENELTQLTRDRKELKEKGVSLQRLRQLDDQKRRIMEQFNLKYDKATR